ncbi:hypothetical protein FRACYDRAFT_272274 [Fragilariopsis cylindrus CCMP1102]|uniref:Uncharacterized protein n=1 Tax=Fragilariopsis cylindrus CCMP1102 TaxID=635003 RepID=A0A1E7EM40_9STRA|nr:hypothetical protein FRACYDRAFT_272274 [Fragilariopsis cylindrus CCMP1102]|eukprot:OEU06954.1 hypothetical protein FRACYDRAFT_272274 [Fragilariopsis cylindrus CCMP1102]
MNLCYIRIGNEHQYYICMVQKRSVIFMIIPLLHYWNERKNYNYQNQKLFQSKMLDIIYIFKNKIYV